MTARSATNSVPMARGPQLPRWPRAATALGADPQPIEPKIHSPRNSGVPTVARRPATSRRDGGEPPEDRGTLDCVADILELGLRKLDVASSSARWSPGRPDLLTQPGRSCGCGRRRIRPNEPERTTGPPATKRPPSGWMSAPGGMPASGATPRGVSATGDRSRREGGRLRIVQGSGSGGLRGRGGRDDTSAAERTPARERRNRFNSVAVPSRSGGPTEGPQPSRSAASKKP